MRKPLLLTSWDRGVLSLAVAFATTGFVKPQDSLSPSMFERHEQPVALGHRVLRPNLSGNRAASFESAADKNVHMKYDQLSGAVRMISGGPLATSVLEHAATAATYKQQALSYLAQHAEIFGVTANEVRLRDRATLITPDVQFLKFDVLRNGTVVADASIDFRFKHGKLVQVANQSFAEAAGDQRPRLANITAYVPQRFLNSDLKKQREIYRVEQTSQEYKLIHVTEFLASADGNSYTVQLDSATGGVFEVRSKNYHVDGTAFGHVHPRWYNDAIEERPYSELTLKWADRRTTTTDRHGNFNAASDGDAPQIDGFSGARVRVHPKTGERVVVDGAYVNDTWQVNYKKAEHKAAHEDEDMAQSMVFYHTNAIIQHAQRYIDSSWFKEPLQANVNLGRSCNAHWDGWSINFYTANDKCPNTGLIADVVYHEWGHGLDDNTGGIDDSAFSEGFGDIVSMLITKSNILGIGFHLNGTPVRDLEPNKVYPDDAGADDPHHEGLIIGSTFWDLFKDLRKVHGEDKAVDLLSQYAFKTIFTASRYTDVYDALLVVDDDNANLTDKTPNYCLINKAFSEHGLATKDSGC